MSGQCKKCGWDGCVCADDERTNAMNTLTPRTDQEIQRYTMVHFITESGDDGYGVKANFTRQLERELTAVTNQRDRLAEALQKLADCDWVISLPDRMDAVRSIARETLQSLTTNEL